MTSGEVGGAPQFTPNLAFPLTGKGTHGQAISILKGASGYWHEAFREKEGGQGRPLGSYENLRRSLPRSFFWYTVYVLSCIALA